MIKKLFTLSLVVVMLLALSVPALANNGNGNGNNKVTNNYLEGAELKQDFNNAQFHCNAISGNGRVWPSVPADMKKFEGQLTFTKAAGTQWNLTGVASQNVDTKGKAIKDSYTNLSMVVCPECGSAAWITFSNNSGVPDGKNIQMQHPGYYITIIKNWDKVNVPGYYAGLKFFADFKIFLSSGESSKVSAGRYLIPEDLSVVKIDEIGCTKDFKLVDGYPLEKDNVYTFLNRDTVAPAEITIVKVWLAECDDDDCECKNGAYHVVDPADYDDAEASFDIYDTAFLEVNEGTYKVDAGKVGEGIEYIISELEIEGWELISDNDLSIIAEGGGKYTVTFYNLYIDPSFSSIMTVTVFKEWESDGDWEIPAGIIESLYFSNDFTLGLPGKLLNSEEDGTLIEVEEFFIDEFDEGIYTYKVEFDRAVLTGDLDETFDTKAVSFEARAESPYEDYTITFYNKVTRELIPTPPNFRILDKIESETHVGKWANKLGYGVFALAGSTTTHHDVAPNYFVAITEDAFAQLGDTIYVGYGSGMGKLEYIIAFTSDGEYKFIDIDGNDAPSPVTIAVKYPGTVGIQSPPHGFGSGNSFTKVEVAVQYVFPNLWGSGAMHAYLLILE